MNDKLYINELNKLSEELDKKFAYLMDNDFSLSDNDFYPPSDNRTWTTNVMDIDGGDNFADYCEEYFEILDQEEYFEN